MYFLFSWSVYALFLLCGVCKTKNTVQHKSDLQKMECEWRTENLWRLQPLLLQTSHTVSPLLIQAVITITIKLGDDVL